MGKETMNSSTTILLIEEDIDLRSLIRNLLERMGYWVIAVPRTEAPPRVVAMAARADLVVSDVTVPDSESIDLTQELLARLPGLPALVIATDDTELVVHRKFSKERTRFLRKPFSFEQLRDAVENALTLASAARPIDEEMRAPHVPLEVLNNARKAPMRRFAAWGLIATAALVMVAGVALRSLEPGPPPLPELAESRIKRGEVFSIVEPTGDRPRIPPRLVWKPISDAALYRIQIRSVDDHLLWEGTSQVATMSLPPDLRRLLQVGVVYFWAVEALDAGAEVLIRSQDARFQVVPPRRP